MSLTQARRAKHLPSELTTIRRHERGSCKYDGPHHHRGEQPEGRWRRCLGTSHGGDNSISCAEQPHRAYCKPSYARERRIRQGVAKRNRRRSNCCSDQIFRWSGGHRRERPWSGHRQAGGRADRGQCPDWSEVSQIRVPCFGGRFGVP